MKKFCLLLCILAFVSQANAVVYYVAPGGNGDGTSWDSPFGSIKTAYEQSDASEVRVKTGSYDFESITLKSGVHLLGGYTGNDEERVSNPALTVWNGGEESSAERFITAPSSNALSSSTTVSGFTFQNNTSTANGGAILMRAYLTLENCIVTGNSAPSGGAILINTDVAGDPIQILNCKIENNNASGGGGGITIGSGSADVEDVSVIIQDSWMTNNTSEGSTNVGGAIYFNNYGNTSSKNQIINCVIANNIAIATGSSYAGGGIAGYTTGNSNVNYKIEVINSTFANNSGEGTGSNASGGISMRYHTGTKIYNTIFFGNTTNSGSNKNIYKGSNATYTVKNCIIDEGVGSGVTLGDDCDKTNYTAEDLFKTDTYITKPGSPAVDAGASADITLPAKDISGTRDRVIGGSVDIGVYEVPDAATVISTVLDSLLVDDVQIAAFDPATLSYPIDLETKISEYPAIHAVAADDYATVSITKEPEDISAALSGTVTITVSPDVTGASTPTEYEIIFNQPVETGLDVTGPNDAVIALKYYTVAGRKIQQPLESGIYIVKTIHASSKVSVSKCFVKK